MSRKITSDFIDQNLLLPGEVDLRYEESPFKHLKKLHAKQAGKRYEQITDNVLTRLGHQVSKALSTEYDRIVDTFRCEFKGSMLNKGTNHFSFLQIRPNQSYDAIIFTMIYPEEIVIMMMTKDIVLKNIENGIFKNQHGGKAGNSGTYTCYSNKEGLLAMGASIID